VLAADTVVVLESELLLKPAGADDQAAMLARLGGRWHEVITGVAVVDAAGGEARSGAQSTRLRLRSLSSAEVEAYVAGGEGADKAGGYAIQGGGGEWLLEMKGDRDNVVGLPMRLVRRLLPEGLLGSVRDQAADGER
jgi:septum formation protein